jgi:hypothetical protein
VPVSPNPFYKEFKADGKILIGFKSEVNIVPNLEMINNGTIYLDDLQGYNPKRRDLGVITINHAEKKRIPVL